MHAHDVDGFFADAATLNLDEHLILDYLIECRGDPRVAAAHLCSEQSTAQWRRVDVDEDYRPRFAAKVLDWELETELSGTSYPLTPAVQGPVSVCRVRIAHPHANFGPRIPICLARCWARVPTSRPMFR